MKRNYENLALWVITRKTTTKLITLQWWLGFCAMLMSLRNKMSRVVGWKKSKKVKSKGKRRKETYQNLRYAFHSNRNCRSKSVLDMKKYNSTEYRYCVKLVCFFRKTLLWCQMNAQRPCTYVSVDIRCLSELCCPIWLRWDGIQDVGRQLKRCFHLFSNTSLEAMGWMGEMQFSFSWDENLPRKTGREIISLGRVYSL